MKVEAILAGKDSRAVTVLDTARVVDAVDVLGEKNIGAILVCDAAGAVKGILSERDIVRRLRSEGPGILEKGVTSCMTENPFTCTPSMTIDEAMAVMTNKRIRHLPVMDSDKLIGVISIGDVVKRKIEQAETEAAALKEYISS